MEKLFISCPMHNRTKNNIEQSLKTLHQEAEYIFGKKLDLIQTYIDADPPNNVNAGIWYLGKSLEKLAEADYFIGCYNSAFVGCNLELKVAKGYGLPYKIINYRDYSCFDDIK